MHSDYPKWSQATNSVTQMKFRQVKRQKNCDKLSYDVSHKESCGTLCLLCYGIFPYSFSYISLANAFGAAQLTQLLSSKLIQTAVILKISSKLKYLYWDAINICLPLRLYERVQDCILLFQINWILYSSVCYCRIVLSAGLVWTEILCVKTLVA